jgi:hypothetical protein
MKTGNKSRFHRCLPSQNVNTRVTAMTRLGLSLILIGWSALAETRADSLRCGGTLVGNGDTPQRLRRRCGEPLRRDFVQEQFWLGGGLRRVRVERWHYEPGNRGLGRFVLIYQGQIVGVRSAEWVNVNRP